MLSTIHDRSSRGQVLRIKKRLSRSFGAGALNTFKNPCLLPDTPTPVLRWPRPLQAGRQRAQGLHRVPCCRCRPCCSPPAAAPLMAAAAGPVARRTVRPAGPRRLLPQAATACARKAQRGHGSRGWLLHQRGTPVYATPGFVHQSAGTRSSGKPYHNVRLP